MITKAKPLTNRIGVLVDIIVGLGSDYRTEVERIRTLEGWTDDHRAKLAADRRRATVERVDFLRLDLVDVHADLEERAALRLPGSEAAQANVRAAIAAGRDVWDIISIATGDRDSDTLRAVAHTAPYVGPKGLSADAVRLAADRALVDVGDNSAEDATAIGCRVFLADEYPKLARTAQLHGDQLDSGLQLRDVLELRLWQPQGVAAELSEFQQAIVDRMATDAIADASMAATAGDEA